MPRRQPLPDELRNRAFSVGEALQHGLTSGRLRGRDLERPFHGVRMPRGTTSGAAPREGAAPRLGSAPLLTPSGFESSESPPDAAAAARRHTQLCRAYATRMPPDQFFSHHTAARLFGLPVPGDDRADAVLHVSVFAPSRAPRLAGVQGHTTAPHAVRLGSIRGLRVTAPIDTWCQLAAVLDVDDLIVLGDALVRRTHPFATMNQLRTAVTEIAGSRGAGGLREALRWIRPGTDSPRETRLRLIIVRSGLPEPEVNGAIANEHGEFVALGDLVYRLYRVLVEYDGGDHRLREKIYNRDVDRLDDVMALAWRVVRINRSHFASAGAPAVHKIRRALLAAGWHPDPTDATSRHKMLHSRDGSALSGNS